MKKITLTIISVMLGALIASGAQATVPELIPVQGVLTDGDGEFIDGATNMTFALYNTEGASSAIWTETQTVDVDEGFFTAYLGEVTALVVADLVSPSELWLGVTVESDDEMDRVQMAAVPFAFEAQRCQQVGNLTESDIFSTETDLTTLLDDNYAPATHDHDSDYAPISHNHSWNDITSDMPAGFADGIDNVGFTTEGELTSLLNDNYASASHDHDTTDYHDVQMLTYNGTTSDSSISSTYEQFRVIGTISKARSDTDILVHWQSHTQNVGSAGSFCHFQLRVNDGIGTGMGAYPGAVHYGGGTYQVVSMISRWTGLGSGSHELSIWVRGNATTCSENTGNFNPVAFVEEYN